jgi:preprotein translocase subunit SecA
VLNPFNFFRKIFGTRNERVIKGLLPLVERINALEPGFEALSDEGLRAKTAEFKGRLAEGETLDDLLPEAFAVAREAAKRTLGQRTFDVQLMGGIAMHRGAIAEMVTGEGKTLTSVAPAYLNALTGRGVHIITVNDYLARRDAQWNRPIYEALDMTVGCIQGRMTSAERHPEYACDITYGTNSEFGFDYLRDNMKTRLEDQVQRDRFFAIIDEVDSILIDEARTPLIISGPAEEATDKYYLADRVVRRWKQQNRGVEKADLDDMVMDQVKAGDVQAREELRLQIESKYFYVYSEKGHSAYLTESGILAAQKELGIPDFYAVEVMNENWPHHLEQAVRAHALYQREVDYVVKDGEVIIVDEFTGRLMEGRRWSDGLHQAVEAKENIKIREENQTLATVTIQNFFRQYDKLSGMTGTALTEAAEFYKIYELDVIVIPTNRPLRRKSHEDRIYLSEKEKFTAVVDEIIEVHREGRPILVGTTSIEASEFLSRLLQKRGIEHEVLNAKHHEREAAIVAKAGQPGAVTIATNMAGRGTDILLGEGVASKGGLHIVGTERHEARRIDNQLRGRAGRQGDPGSSLFYVSLEDALMRKFAREGVKRLLARLGMGDGQEITSPMVSRAIQRAQKKVEEHNFDIRKNLLEYDKVNDEQRKAIYGRRTAILKGEDLDETVWDLVETILPDECAKHMGGSVAPDDWQTGEIASWAKRKFDIELDPEELRRSGSAEAAADIVREKLRAEIAQAREAMGEDDWNLTLRYLLLRAFDDKWKEHLRDLDALRQGIGLRGYAQQDPKLEYKREASLMFSEMQTSIAEMVTDVFLRIRVTLDEMDRQRRPTRNLQLSHEEVSAYETEADQGPVGSAPEKPEPIRRDTPKVGRNDPCPCGSGKKYKKCCG